MKKCSLSLKRIWKTYCKKMDKVEEKKISTDEQDLFDSLKIR